VAHWGGAEHIWRRTVTERAVFGLWKTYVGRRTAVEEIRPLLEGTRLRLGGIPDTAWQDPYVVGFLGMLISSIATNRAGRLDTDDLAAVQSSAWADITGMPGEMVGEEMCFLSASNDSRFIFGCRNAETFLEALRAGQPRAGQLDVDETVALPAERESRSILWSRYFDAQLTAPSNIELQPGGLGL
jgi:hypothetical protein